MGVTIRYEAYCDHCHAGMLSRDALVNIKGQRLCSRCCMAKEEMEARVLRLSGWLLLVCTLAGGALGYLVFHLAGSLAGLLLGVVAAGIIENSLKRF